MRNFIAKLQQIFSIDELRGRILLTIGLIAIYRLGRYITLPGIDGAALEAQLQQGNNSLLGLVNMFSGGSFNYAAVFALGIMPYISASIVVQLLGFALPSFARLQKEGQSGQQRLNQITRVLTIFITIIQSGAYLTYLKGAHASVIAAEIPYAIFWISNIVLLTAGTMFCMWLGERITEKGIGNGVSLLISAGIVNSLPTALWSEFTTTVFGGKGGPILFIVEMLALFVVVAAAIAIVQAVRRIPIQFVKHMIGRDNLEAQPAGADRNYLPIKLNASGVMPIIFAQALMFIPAAINSAVSGDEQSFLASFSNPATWTYNITFFFLIVIFTYVYTALTVNPQQYAEHLKRQNAHIPGKLQGEQTEQYIDKITSLITLPGALSLGLIAILPGIVMATDFTKDQNFAMFFGGTSLLILVSVVLDTLQQIESHLVMRQYDGLLEGTRIKGRNAEKMPV